MNDFSVFEKGINLLKAFRDILWCAFLDNDLSNSLKLC